MFFEEDPAVLEAQPPESVTVQTDVHTPPEKTYTPPKIDMATAIPPEYRDKSYFKDLDFPGLIKQHAELQSKLGQRPPVGVPGADATSEQIESFYASLRPKEATSYEFPETEFSKAQPRDENFQNQMRDVFHKAGISQHQANILTEGYDEILTGLHSKVTENDQKFDDQITEIYKDGREEALTRAKDLMSQNIPESLKPLLNEIPNNALLLLTTTLNNVYDKYIKEDSIHDGDPTFGDPVALRREAMEIMQSNAYKDFRNPGHEAAKQKVAELYKQIGVAQTKT